MPLKQAIHDGLQNGLQWTVIIGSVKLFMETYLFYYLKKKKSFGNGFLFSLATNLLSSFLLYALFVPFIKLFRLLTTTVLHYTPCCTEQCIFLPYAIIIIWIANIACSFLLSQILKIKLSFKQLLIIFTSSTLASAALSILFLQSYSTTK